MYSRRLLSLFLASAFTLGLAGCNSAEKKKDQISKPAGNLKDQSDDTSFQAFVSTLRKAAGKRDVQTMAMMMTADFGYSWEPGGEGPGVFEYWNQNRLWPELNAVLRDKFVPSGDYMVAPPQVTFDPDFKGYRAGLRLVNGSWRFAYFVPSPPAH